MIHLFERIWKFAENRHGSMIRGLIFSFLRSVFGLTQILAILTTIEVVTGQCEPHAGVIRVCILTVICVIGNYATSYIEQTSTLTTGFFMCADKRMSIGNVLRNVPLGYFNSVSSGHITAVLTTTLAGVETAVTMVMIGIISGLFNAFALFLFMMVYDWRIGLLCGAGMIAYLLVVRWQMSVSRSHAPVLQKIQTTLSETVLTFLKGIKVTKTFSFTRGDTHLKKAIQDSCEGNIHLTNVSMPSQFAAGLIVAVFESLLFVCAVLLYRNDPEFTLVQTIVMMIFSFMAYASLNQAGSMLSMIGLLDSGLKEAEDIENTEQMQQVLPEQTAQDNRIVFDHVSFSYGDHEVLHDISTVIEPDTFTAVIGPSGSGKTTMCQLIPRFRDVNSGKITIGGADIRNMNQEELMKKISMVFQRVYLFEDTILNNIRFARPEATLEEVREAARAARCDDFIMSLPQGYDTVISEGGNSLSGGEKQRISVARAILKDSPIIILDEATSALDAENEHELLLALDELTRNKTVIMIAHRIQSVQKADHILAIRNGQIVQEGTHQQLIEQEGLYRDFFHSRSQAAGWKVREA